MVSYHKHSSTNRNANLQTLYDSHNGILEQADKKFLVSRYGAKSATTYVDFKLGRTKLKLLLGEYLTIDFDPTVVTVNTDAIRSKAELANVMRGAMYMKKDFEKVEKLTGIKPLNGMKIPDESDPDLFSKLYPKTQNEVIMQIILEDFMKDGMVKLIGYETLADVMITSECFVHIAKDDNGMEYLEIVNPKSMIFQESSGDPFCRKSPFMGHFEYMYVKDILKRFKLTEEQKLKLRDEETNTPEHNARGWKILNGVPAVPVYFLEWKTVREYPTKISKGKNGEDYYTDIDPDTYRRKRKSFDTDVEQGQYTIETNYREDIWEGVRIGEEVYPYARRKPAQIQTRNEMNKYKAEFDYSCLLFGTVDGIRISLQELINGLSAIYNVIMFQIVREIRKMKGKVFVYDESARPRMKDMKSVMFDIEEHGVIRVSSSSEQNYAQADIDNAVGLIKELDLGLSQSFNVLTGLKYDIENTIDRITGINENREGLGKASQTATGATQNIEASRTITKDIFFVHNLFMQDVLRKFLEKRKTNWEWIDSQKGQLLLGPILSRHLKLTKEITNDDYGVYLSDGRKENQIRELIRPFFIQEINAGQLRTMDVIAFERTRNLTVGLTVLERAWSEVQKVAQEQLRSKEQIQAQKDQAALQLAKEDREDWQAHEQLLQDKKDVVQLKKIGAEGLRNEANLETQRDLSETETP